MCVKPSGAITTPKLQHQRMLHQINSWQFIWCNVLHRVTSNRFPPNVLMYVMFSAPMVHLQSLRLHLHSYLFLELIGKVALALTFLPGPFAPPPLRSVQKVSPECPRNLCVTLMGHMFDTLDRHVGRSLAHPCFRGHSGGHSPGQLGPKGPGDPCSWLSGSQPKSYRYRYWSVIISK